jgi:hypothetical protein
MEAIEAVMEINKLFKANGWVGKDNKELVFNGFCKLFVLLEPEQRKLLLELTEKYHWITHNEYPDRIIQALQSIAETELIGVTKIYFFPIIKPGDDEKAKSGDHMLYLIKAYKHLMDKYGNVKFELLKTFDQIHNLDLEKEQRLFLIDDYVGSGETFDFCINELKKNATLIPSLIKIACIAIQEETFYNLVIEGFGVLKTLALQKGITDNNVSQFIEIKKNLMREIERHIPGATSYSLGYNETEALVTMMRTPDNTFPIFWKKFRKNGQYVDAPFSRNESI